MPFLVLISATSSANRRSSFCVSVSWPREKIDALAPWKRSARNTSIAQRTCFSPPYLSLARCLENASRNGLIRRCLLAAVAKRSVAGEVPIILRLGRRTRCLGQSSPQQTTRPTFNKQHVPHRWSRPSRTLHTIPSTTTSTGSRYTFPKSIEDVRRCRDCTCGLQAVADVVSPSNRKTEKTQWLLTSNICISTSDRSVPLDSHPAHQVIATMP